MYKVAVLGLEQCRNAIQAMTAEFMTDPSRAPIAMAIVDELGDLITYGRTDRCRPSAARNAIKKAYTAALRGVDSGVYAELVRKMGRNSADLGDPMLFPFGGGVVVVNPADRSVLGGIGVAGLPTSEEDEALARLGLRALGL